MKARIGQIEIEGKDLAELEALLAFLPKLQAASQALGVTIAPSVTPKATKASLPVILAGGEPNVEKYLAHPSVIATGNKQFRLTNAEKESGMSRDQAALARLQLMEAIESGQGASNGGAMAQAIAGAGEDLGIDLDSLSAGVDEEGGEDEGEG